MSFIGERNFGLEVVLGNVPGYGRIFKFGQALDCDAGIETDIWDGADGVTSTDVWVRPTAARIHDIASTSANDTAGGTGQRTIRVFGLTSWAAAEVSEDLAMNGASNVPTANAYVIIHRMKGTSFGSGATNAGIITATAQTDATVTAAIQAAHGQTLMAIYGVPSTQKLAITDIDVSVLRAGAGSALVDACLLVDERADQSDSGFLKKHVFSTGEAFTLTFDPPLDYSGPCLVKLQVISSVNNVQTTASFNAFLVDN